MTSNTVNIAIGFLAWPGMLSYSEVYEFANFFAREIATAKKGMVTDKLENKTQNE